MAKQVKVDRSSEQRRLATRSPFTNLLFAAILGLIYMTVFSQSPQSSLVYATGAFLFFNTVDYCVLYYRMNKEDK